MTLEITDSTYVRYEAFAVVTMKSGVFWNVISVALVRTDGSEEPSASITRVTRIGELEITIAVTNNRRTLRRNSK
jgi:hypothetical protein